MLIAQNVCWHQYSPQGPNLEDMHIWNKTLIAIAKLNNKIKRTMPKYNSVTCVATEDAWAYHSMKHDFSFRPNDHSYKLILPIFILNFLLYVQKLKWWLLCWFY